MNRIRAGRNSLSSTVLNAAVLAAFALSSFQLPANADSYSSGLQYYQARQFTAALNCFQSAVSANPSNYNAIYYKALCHQQLRQTPQALDAYRDLASRFPTSAPGRQALQVLRVSDPTFLRNLISGGSRGGGSSVASASSSSTSSSSRSYGSSSYGSSDTLPSQEKVIFHKDPNGAHLWMNGQVNGGQLDFVFDTGCDRTVIGMDHLSKVGLSRPTGEPVGKSIGLGNQITDNYLVNTTVRIGGIERKNFPLLVSDRSGTPALLGRNFYEPYNYTVDNNANTILFEKKSSNTGIASSNNRRSYSGSSGDSVPFKRDRSGPLVSVQVNGRPISMLFDTGSMNCLFSRKQIQSLGISIPDNATDEQSRGVGGASFNKVFPVSSMKLGNIEKTNFMISVTELNLEEPLLGQTFFKDLQYTIDDQNSVIRFVRR